MKQLLQHKTETTETLETYYCNICVRHMKNPNQNNCNIRLETCETF
jgi:hypothetical protein